MCSWYKVHMKKTWLPRHIKYLFFVYLTGIAFFTLFRFFLFLTNLKQLQSLPAGKTGLIIRAFIMGFRFDTVISGYILGIPLILLSICTAFSADNKIIYRVITLFFGSLYSVAFFICALDIPYFTFFNSRVSAVIFNWFNTPGILFTMTAEDIVNWIYVFFFVLCCVIFWFIIIKIKGKILSLPAPTPAPPRTKYTLQVTGLSLLALLLLFIGTRGRIAKKSPIRVGTAYFSNYSFPNQLGLNPVFTFVRTSIDRFSGKNQELKLMEDEKAIRLVQYYLKIEPKENLVYDSPIARPVETEGEPLKANVVVVIMESMAAVHMSRYGNPNKLTPNLDRLAESAYTFDNIYTSGIHTSNGIFSTLFSFAAIFKQHPMKPASMLSYAGLPNILRARGYRTIFFCTHDDQFDNMGGFLRTNGVEYIVSEKDYPAVRVLSTLGVPDNYMFEFSIPKINKLYEGNNPFLAIFLTASDHPPFIIPENIPFEPRTKTKKEQIVEYADWSIGEFLNLASQQEWFANTIFVFIADHGLNINPIYDLPLSYFHTPFIIYSPHLIKEHRYFAKIGGQIDVFPTIMGVLNISYVNNTIGIDLLKENRPFIHFANDDKMGCLNDEYFLVSRGSDLVSLYAYRKRETKNYMAANKQLAESMKDYLFAMMQTTQWLIKNRKVGVQQPQSPAQPRQLDQQ